MSSIETTLAILAKYGFTNITSQGERNARVSHEFEYIHLEARIYTFYEDGEINVEFAGELIKQSKSIDYNINYKKDQDRLKGRANRFRRQSKKVEDERSQADSENRNEYKALHTKLVEAKVAFDFQITRTPNGNRARIVTNGYNLDIGKDFIVSFRLGQTMGRLQIQEAIEIANLLPEKLSA